MGQIHQGKAVIVSIKTNILVTMACLPMKIVIIRISQGF